MESERIIEIDYARCAKALLRNLALIIAVVAFSLALGGTIVYYTMDREDNYEARASIFSKSGDVYEETLDVVQYADIVKSLKVAERAADLINDDNIDRYMIYDMLTVEYDDSPYTTISSAVINIYAKSSDKNVAVKVVNAVAKAFTVESFNITGANRFEVLDVASEAEKVYSAQKEMILYTALAGAIGVFLVCFIIVLIEILSLRLHTIKDGKLYGKLDIIGVVPKFNSK